MAWNRVPTVRYCTVILIMVLLLDSFVWVCDCAAERLCGQLCVTGVQRTMCGCVPVVLINNSGAVWCAMRLMFCSMWIWLCGVVYDWCNVACEYGGVVWCVMWLMHCMQHASMVVWCGMWLMYCNMQVWWCDVLCDWCTVTCEYGGVVWYVTDVLYCNMRVWWCGVVWCAMCLMYCNMWVWWCGVVCYVTDVP